MPAGVGRSVQERGTFRHYVATHLGEKNVELQTIMAKTRRRNPRSAMRYIKPGAEAVADATDLLDVGRGRR